MVEARVCTSRYITADPDTVGYFAMVGEIGVYGSREPTEIEFKDSLTLKKMDLYINSTGGEYLQIWGWKNNSSGNLTIQTANTGWFSDSDSESISSGDTFCWRYYAYSGDASKIWSYVGVTIDKSGSMISYMGSYGANGQLPGVTKYITINGIHTNHGSTDDVKLRYKAKSTFTLSGIAIYVNSNNVSTSTFYLRINGANSSNVSIAFTGTGRFTDTSGSDTVSVDDTLSFSLVTGGSGTALYYDLTYIKVTDTNLKAPIAAGINSGFNPVYDNYYCALANTFPSSQTEGAAQGKWRGQTALLKNAQIYLTTNNNSSTSYFRLRKNGTAVISITITGSGTGRFENTSDSTTISDGDLFCWKYDPGSGTGNIYPTQFGIESYFTLGTKTFTIDAILTRMKQFTIDSILIARVAKTFTTDAILVRAKKWTMDAVLIGVTKSVASPIEDFFTVVQHTKTLTLDALLKLVNSKTFTIDGYLLLKATKTFTTDALLKGIATKTFSIDGLLKKAFTKTFTTDAILKLVGKKTFTIDGYLVRRLPKTFSIDAMLKKVFSKTFSTDGILVWRKSKTFSTDAMLKKANTKSFSTDAMLKKAQTRTFSIDGLLKKSFSKTFSIDAMLKKSYPKTFLTDAILVRRLGKTFTTDGLLKKAFGKQFSLDSVLVYRKTKTFSIDAILASSVPTIISPKQGEEVNSPVYLLFTSSMLAGPVKKHFYLEVDKTSNAFGDIEISKNSRLDQTNWTYWNGGSWVALPYEGLDPAYYGNNVRYYATLTNGQKWWRVTEDWRYDS